MVEKTTVHNQVGILHTKKKVMDFDLKKGTGTFSLQRFVLETSSSWTDKDGNVKSKTEIPEFVLFGGNISLFEDILVGAKINVSFVLRGKISEGKEGKIWHNTDCECIGVKVLELPVRQDGIETESNNPFLDSGEANMDDDDQLPF